MIRKKLSVSGITKLQAVIIIVIIVVAAVAGASYFVLLKPPEKRILTLAVYGGEVAENIRVAFLDEFEEKNNVEVVIVSGVSSEQLARLRAQKEEPQIDVVVMDLGDAILAKREGLLEKLSEEEVPNLRNLYDLAKDPYHPGWTLDVLVLVYNTNFVKEEPKSWNEMWKPEYKDKVNIFGIPIVIGYETVMIAALLSSGDLYNMDAGFKYMEKLKPNVHGVVAAAAMTIPAVASGEIWLLPFWNARTQLNIDKGAPIGAARPQEGSFAQMNTVSLVKNAKNPELGKKLINVMLSEEAQRKFAEIMYYGPTNKLVKLPPEIAKRTVYGPEDVAKLWLPDYDFVNEHRAEWDKKFKEIFGGL